MEERHVVTCFLEHRGKVLLLRRSQRVGTYRGRWAGVSGFIEAGVTPVEQAWTELAEETGLAAADADLAAEGRSLEVADAALDRTWVVHPFRFRVLSPEKVRLDWEHTESRWIAPDDIGRHDTVPGLLEAWQRVAPVSLP